MLASHQRPKLSSLNRLVFALAFMVAAGSSAQTPFDELKSKLGQALRQNASEVDTDEKIAKTGKMYVDRLADLRAEFVKGGNLDGVLEVEDEIGRFKSSGGIPDEFSPVEALAQSQRIYAQEIKKIQSKEMVGLLHYYGVYEEALVEKEEELVRKGFIDKAVEVREERVRINKLMKSLSKSRPGPIPMKRFASLREQVEDVFSRPVDSDTAVPAGDDPEAARDEPDPSSKAFDALKAQFERLLSTHREIVASSERKMLEKYIKELQVRKFHYQSQGSLDGVLALQAEMKRLEDKGAISKGDTELKHLEIVRENFTKDLKELKSSDRERLITIYRQYLDGLRELEQSLVKKEGIDAAIIVRKERKRAAEAIQNRAKKDLVLSLYETRQEAEE